MTYGSSGSLRELSDSLTSLFKAAAGNFCLAAGFAILALSSCEDSMPHDEIPRVYVYEEINLNDFRYQALKLNGGFVYINGGVRGIIIYRKTQSEYLAFERNCPYQPAGNCALVSVDDSNLFMTDSCCGSTFDFDGIPVSGPVRFRLLQYAAIQSQDILTISSD
jgi:hypothetical protein